MSGFKINKIMCGISGIVNFNNSKIDLDALKKMTYLLKHRGPNAEGFHSIGNIGLGHTRLSVLDLSELGNQPMHYLDRYTIVFNGEIYNYIELREQLKKMGHQFISKSDTEVILASYHQWGEKCVQYFNGMWAFAIHDRLEKNIFCSRDRFGVKPFYYTAQKNNFIFSSEIKPLLTFNDISIKPNNSIVLQYLICNTTDHSNDTFFENIQKLPPSHNLIFDLNTNKFEIKRYYTITKNDALEKINLEDAVVIFKSLFEDSIQLRLRSDIKVGSCLSGGLDSSSIVSLASNHYNNNLSKFTAITAQVDGDFDETQYAQKVVNYCDINWIKTKPTALEFSEEIDKVIYTQEEPFSSPSVYLQYKVMETARKNGIQVLLDGQGGDETMLGYPKYILPYLNTLPLKERIIAFINAKKNFNLSYKYLVQNNIYFSNFNVRKNRLLLLAQFAGLDKNIQKSIDWSSIRQYAEATKSVFEVQKIEIENTMLPMLLRYEDKNSMAHGIETRLPFLDYRLVEFNLSINNNHKINSGFSKFILRKAIEGKLPNDITWRKNKIGFTPSDDMWKNAENMDKTIAHSAFLRQFYAKDLSKIAKNAPHRWRLFNLAKWAELFLEC
jgi:asparagine synthase (glutamine-hydrolysing)